MAQLVEQLKTTIPSTLELEEHQNRIQEIEQEAKERHNRAFKELADRALERGIQLVRTPGGYAMAPVRNGEVIGPEEYEKLSAEDRQQIEDAVKELQEELKEVIERIPRWRMETRDKIKELNRQATRLAIGHLLSKLRRITLLCPTCSTTSAALEKDVIEHTEEFQPQEETPPNILGMPTSNQPNFHRYRVNLLVDNSKTKGRRSCRKTIPATRT